MSGLDRDVRVRRVRDADGMLEGVQADINALSFQDRMNVIALMAGEQCEFDQGADEFCLVLAQMQLWAGECGQQMRSVFTREEARAKFMQVVTIGGEDGMEQKACRINEWLTHIGWKGPAVTAADLERLLFFGEAARAEQQ